MCPDDPGQRVGHNQGRYRGAAAPSEVGNRAKSQARWLPLVAANACLGWFRPAFPTCPRLNGAVYPQLAKTWGELGRHCIHIKGSRVAQRSNEDRGPFAAGIRSAEIITF